MGPLWAVLLLLVSLSTGCGGDRPPVRLRMGVLRAACPSEQVDVLWRLAGGTGSQLPRARGPLARNARIVPRQFDASLAALSDSLHIEWLQQVEPDTLRTGNWSVASSVFEADPSRRGYLLQIGSDSTWTEFLVAPDRALFVRRPDWERRGDALYIVPEEPLQASSP